MQLKAYAKLNLALEILSRRDDGFHDLVGVMQTISLADTLSIQRSDTLSLAVPGHRELAGDDNLVMKAAKLLAGGQAPGAQIILTKKIPSGAGLGGGSADAALTLMALNEFWNLGHSHQHLWDLAQSLGSDIPFFLTGGSASVAGRGEIIKPLPYDGEYWFVLIQPPFSISTAWAYQAFDKKPQPSSGSTEKVVEALARADALKLGQALGNNMEGPVFAQYPQLAQYKQALLNAGALGAAMSGSGSTIFGLFASKKDAQAARCRILELRPEVEINVVRTVGREELREQEKAWQVENLRGRE